MTSTLINVNIIESETDQPQSYRVPNTHTVLQLVHQISINTKGVTVQDISLMCKGKLMMNANMTLQEYGVVSNTVLVMSTSTVGGN
jgi:hypothetical protein